MERRPTTRYFLAVTGCIAFCLAAGQGLIANHPHFPSQSIALVVAYTLAVALASHSILIVTGSRIRWRILIGTLVTMTFCVSLVRSGYFDWKFILPDYGDTVWVIFGLSSAVIFYLIDAWFLMYRQTMFAPATTKSE